MPRKSLSKDLQERIRQKVPATPLELTETLAISPDFIAMILKHDERLSSAKTCLSDAVDVANEARYALTEAHANVIWYREEALSSPSEEAAVFFGKFYCDDAALRLYAAGEHVAQFIEEFLELERDRLAPYKKGGTSNQATVGKYLKAEEPSLEITKIVQRLTDERNWRTTMRYRSQWVHDQPAIFEGSGLRYRRGPRWKEGEKGSFVVGISGGDEARFSIDEFIDIASSAYRAFMDALSDLTKLLISRLEREGFTFTRDDSSTRSASTEHHPSAKGMRNDVRFTVNDLPPKKGADTSMWNKGAEKRRLETLRYEAIQAMGGGGLFEGPLSLSLTLFASPDDGDLDNFVAGICDGLMAAHTNTPISDSDWSDLPEEIRPSKPIAFADDKILARICAERRPPSSKGCQYEVGLESIT